MYHWLMGTSIVYKGLWYNAMVKHKKKVFSLQAFYLMFSSKDQKSPMEQIFCHHLLLFCLTLKVLNF